MIRTDRSAYFLNPKTKNIKLWQQQKFSLTTKFHSDDPQGQAVLLKYTSIGCDFTTKFHSNDPQLIMDKPYELNKFN